MTPHQSAILVNLLSCLGIDCTHTAVLSLGRLSQTHLSRNSLVRRNEQRPAVLGWRGCAVERLNSNEVGRAELVARLVEEADWIID
jgi:hypothetical protein